jgi:8-oxo-dGTP pyrophosphatase MutT (NUDIX family)
MEEYNLPFDKVTARAIIMRREDGCLLGVLHKKNGRYAPPGGHLKDGEAPHEALQRELEEENIRLIDADTHWEERIAMDYYAVTKTLNIWYIFLVEDVQVGECDEVLDVRWLNQTQDVWYPQMREKIFLAIKTFVPDMLKVDVSVLESW